MYLSPCTFNPHAKWMALQAHAFVGHAHDHGLPVGVVLRDRGGPYQSGFDGTLKAHGCRVQKVGIQAPNMNAYVERFVQAIQQECLDKLIVFGREHLDHVAGEYAEHYNTERPHQAMGNLPLNGAGEASGPATGDVVCPERLGGVLRHYFRRAA